MTERRGIHEVELDPRASALLQALRVAEDPRPAARERVWARLEASTAAEAIEAETNHVHGAKGMSNGTWAVIVLAAAAVVLLAGRGGVLGPLVAGRGGEAASYSEAPPEPAPVVARAGEARRGADREGVVEEGARESAPEGHGAEGMVKETGSEGHVDDNMASDTGNTGRPRRADGSMSEVRARADGPRAPGARERAEEPGADAGGSLAAEAEALARAQAAIQGGRAEAALAELAGYARRFPQGVLREEHDALRAIALCAAGRTREGRGEAQAFLRDRGGSALAERVRGACLEGQAGTAGD